MIEKRYSKILQQNIVIDKENQTLIVQDGTMYDSFELSFLQHMENHEKLYIHQIKNIFSGRIIK